MGDGTCTKAGLVGEDAPGDAFFHTHKEGSDHSAGDSRRIKGAVYDRGEYSGNPVNVKQNYSDSEHDIKQRHKGNQLFRHASDSFDASEKNQGYQSRQNDSDDKAGGTGRACIDQMIIHQCGIDGGCDGIYLSGITGSEYGENSEDRKQSGQPAPVFPKTVLYVVHGAANQVAFLIYFAEVHGQSYLREFCTHPQNRGDPHPEDGTGPSDGDGTGYSGDVAGAYRGSQSGTDRLKRRHGTVGCVPFTEHPAEGNPDRIGEFADLQKIGADTQIEPHSDDADHGGDSPDKIVHGIVDGFNCI